MGGLPELPTGLATLPSEQPVGLAVDGPGSLLLDRAMPTLAAPDGPGTSLLSMAVSAFEGVRILQPGQLQVDHEAFGLRPASAESCEGAEFAPLRSALEVLGPAAGDRAAVRVDMVGPVTLAVQLLRAGVERGRATEAARMACVFRSESLFRAVRALDPAVPVAVVMDEQSLVGSMHPTFPFGAREVRSLVDPVVDALDKVAGTSDVVIGMHVPGRADWRTIISSGISLLSMPPDPALIGWAEWIQALLDNGGHIAWGAVPVDRPLGTSAELLWRHLAAAWRDLASAGVDERKLVDRSLVAPSNGLGAYAPEQVPGVVSVVDSLAERVGAHAGASLAPVLA